MRTHGDLKPLLREKSTHCPLNQYDQIWYQSRMQTNSIGGQAAMLQTTFNNLNNQYSSQMLYTVTLKQTTKLQH